MIADIHMHVVPKVDDGSLNLSMSLEMLGVAYDQGARLIYCTSHNRYEMEDTNRYKAQFMTLQMMAKARFPDLELLPGCEILCCGDYMEDIVYGLEIGAFLPLGGSKCVLTEFYSDVTPEEANTVVSALIDAGWKPILAHVERYPALFEGNTFKILIELGAMVQVNLFSLQDEQDEQLKGRARLLIQNRLAHFIGSDAHRTDHRAPSYESGIQYLKEHCNQDYFKNLCYRNALRYLKCDAIETQTKI